MSTARVVLLIGATVQASFLLTCTGPQAAQSRAPGEPASVVAATEDASLYFPPAEGPWESVDPAEAGWDADRLDAAIALAGERNSTGVVILHAGRILAERHWTLESPSRGHANGSHGPNAVGHAIEDVASVQKSVVAVLVGLAQERGLLALDDPVTDHAGRWTEATEEQERAVTIRHLMAMTTGLTPALEYDAAPGSKWLYNTPAYHRLLRIVAASAGLDRNDVTRQWLTGRLGMRDSRWEPRPWASSAIATGFAATARDLARFGLLILAGGIWDGETVIEDTAYLAEMLRPSQALNPSYGLLWWTNGQASSMSWAIPPVTTAGTLIPAAPDDLVAAQGARDRKLYVVPSLDLVVARLGDNGSRDGSSFNDAFWERLKGAAPGR
ncbi:MAG: serine hydrolase [Acidobacteria bacterium]|nr:serine hydrolase [Acidobacteriota bacterium]MYH27557.1 serine hydrolase [Acidobacteriota bacterium]